MSVAPRAAPSMSERSRMLSRRGSNRDDEELAVGAVVVMLSDKTEDQGAAYRPPTSDGGQDDSKPISASASQKEQCFVAVLAPTCDTAMASLVSQPPGTFLLVKEEDAAITVYIKFRQAVRALTLVKGKDIKKNDDAIQLAKLRKKELDVLMQTPVHNLRLTSEAYFLVEHCWKRFLPQVQAVVFELCCESYLDEEAKLEDWTPSMIPSTYSLGLMPETCGFYILVSPGVGADSSSAVIHVRQVEFDFIKFAITVADGTLKPSALLLSTSFAAKRTFEPHFTFSAIRDNFLSPDQVMLKETSINTIPTQQSTLQNCIDLNSNDKELSLLIAAEAACGAVMPHEPLPETFLSAIREIHVHFADVIANTAPSLSTKPALWSAQKMKLVSRIIPILLELLIASAAFSESNSSADQMDVHAAAVENKKRQIMAQFSHAMRFDILFMTARSDDFVICRLAHQLCQLVGARVRLPAELVDFIRDLVALFPVFLRLFLRNQGIVTLWKNLHHNDLDKDAPSDSRGKSSFRSFRALTSSTTVVNALQGKGDRKPLLFGLSRKPQTKSRKSLSLGTNLSTAPFLSSKALAFFRLSPLSVQVDLGTQLREGQFSFLNIWKEDEALARIAFCCCDGQQVNKSVSRFYSKNALSKRGEEIYGCARKRLRSSPTMITYELLLQLSLRFLYNKTSFASWDRDVALLLRLEEVHRHLFNEIISIVHRRAEAQDVNTQEALSCELRVTIACLSTLFRLERKRRLEISSAVGDKRYLTFIHLFRTKLRELNERLQVESSNAEALELEGEDGSQAGQADEPILIAMAEIFRWIPKSFLNEWIVLSLKELLQLMNELSNAIKQTQLPLIKQVQYVHYAHEVFQVFAVMIRRTSDPDIQTILVRVLGMDCSSIVSLLRFTLSPHALGLNGGRDAICIQKHTLTFFNAFVNLDVALPVQTEWESRNRKPSEDDSMDEDSEVIEQLKGELLIRLLGPRMEIEDGEQNDQSLWDFILELMFPSGGSNIVASFNASSRMLNLAVSFRSPSIPPTLLTTIARAHFQMKEAFLLLQQALYTAQDVSSPIDYDNCIASHMRHIEQYCDRIIDNSGQEDHNMVYRATELHLRCLVTLACRRNQFPAIQEAFNRAHLLSTILNWFQPKAREQQDAVSARSQHEHGGSVESTEAGTSVHCLPPLNLSRQISSTDSFSGQPAISKLTLSTPHLTSSTANLNIPQHFLVLEPGLHALAIVLLVSFIIVDPSLEIDDKICPRVSVPAYEDAATTKPTELLWTLQQHLAVVEMDQRYFEALTIEMEALQALVSTERVSAIRLLLRLLCPNLFDYNMYTSHSAIEQNVTVATKHSRKYIAKGAFSTVYRQHPAFPQPEAVATKVVEHQRRAGELCPVSGLFNEVVILSKLRGDLAATQLVDFGNHHTEQNFEIIMEYCPCSLTEWRATITRMSSEVPFRSCLVMILRAFEEACHCLARIHEAGICHFDIKSDNILVRTTARELSRRLLENEEEHEDDDHSSVFRGWLCFGDFGESKIVDSDRLSIRTFTFSSFSSGNASPVVIQRQAERFMSLSRTRGTEAIKSPEALKIKGSEEVEVKVTLASDIWSLGCLLYELVTRELLFQNDDWAGLYAHLVVNQDQHVLRHDHTQKMAAALNPTCTEEEAVVKAVSELCSKILSREPSQRPKLKTITKQVRKLINDVYDLPVTASDESFIISLYQLNGEGSTPDDTSAPPAFRPFINLSSCCHRAQEHGVTTPARLFWNFFLAGHVTQDQDSRAVASCVGNGHGPASKDILAMDDFESRHEGVFAHFVYLAWHESTSPPGEPNAHECFIEELHEEDHRTCFLLNPHLKSSVETQLTPDVHLFQQLVQHAPQYFPVLQRRLREEAGYVVFIVLGKDAEDTKELQGVLTGMLLFFLRSAFAMTPFDILSYFARTCAQFFDYPRVGFMQHFLSYTAPVIKDSATSNIVQCRCGASVLTLEPSAMNEALSSQHCTCKRSSDDETDASSPIECPCFHPFPANDEPADFDDEVYPIDTMFVHDSSEEQLVHPFECRSKRGDEVRWISVDAVCVGRMESAAFRWSPPAPHLSRGTSSGSNRSITAETGGTGTATSAGSERRMSRFGVLKQRASKVAGETNSPRLAGKDASRAAVEPHELQEMLVRGLQRCGKPGDASSSASWELYECEFCRLPICAVADGRVAVPMLHPRSSDSQRSF